MSIKISLKIFLFAIIFYITRQIELYALLMIFALIHELGHLICGILLGFKPKSMYIMPFGLCIEFKVMLENSKNKTIFEIKKIVIAAFGPLTNLIVILICILINTNIENIVYANLLILLFNLLPIYPLDGARILEGILKIKKGTRYSIEKINLISNITVVLVTIISSITIYIFRNISMFFIVIYLWIVVIKQNKIFKTKMRAYNVVENNKNY